MVAKKDAHYVLHYVNRSYGETDVPDQVPEFISQRRRWLNGSFFAGVYALWHWRKVWTSDHSFVRKMAFMVEDVYNTYNMLFAWFAMVSYKKKAGLAFVGVGGRSGVTDIYSQISMVMVVSINVSVINNFWHEF